MSIITNNLYKIKRKFTLPFIDRILSRFTQKKDFNNFFVKLLPSNLDYNANAIRRKKINNITYDLHLNQWMEYVLYFGIINENKSPLYNLVKPGMTIIDVGVNFGETLLNFAQLTGSSGKVYGFEPMPYIYSKCLNNINLNSFSNITLENLALGNKNEKLRVNDPMNGNSGGTFVSQISDNATDLITINAITLDEFVSQHGLNQLDLIKIDVEGFETNVIKGAYNSLIKFRPLLYIELCDENLKRAGSSSVELINILMQLKYDIKQANTMRTIEVNNLSNHPHTDIIAIPQPPPAIS